MQLQEMFITSNNQGDLNTCVPQYIVIHDTGNKRRGANALNHYKWLNNNNDLGRSAHIFIDCEKAIQVIPFNRMSFHTGVLYKKGVDCPACKNHNSIGVEFCVNEDGNLTQTLKHLVDIIFYLQQKFQIPLDHVITHQMSAGKSCPETFMSKPYLWTQLKEDLAKTSTQSKTFEKAIANIHQHGIINSPAYWRKQTDINVQNLIINMSNYLDKESEDK